jgi:hypothetical protein
MPPPSPSARQPEAPPAPAAAGVQAPRRAVDIWNGCTGQMYQIMFH